MQKKGRKYIFNFEIHIKNIKKGKKKAHLFGFFRFYIPCAFFWILNLKIHIKKTKMQKKNENKYFCFFLQFRLFVHEFFKMQKKRHKIGTYKSKEKSQKMDFLFFIFALFLQEFSNWTCIFCLFCISAF